MALPMARPPGYRYGSWLILHGSGAYLVGYSTACWLARDGNDTLGLWTRCQQSQCGALTMANAHAAGWLMVTRGLASMGVIFILLWLIASCQCQWLQHRQQRYHCLMRLEEMLALTSGCCSLLAVGLFAVSSARDKDLGNFSLSWSLWLVVGGASAITVGAVIVASTRSYALNVAPKPTSRSTIGPSEEEVGLERGGAVTTLSAGEERGRAMATHGNHTARGGRLPQHTGINVTDIFHVTGSAYGACPRVINSDSTLGWSAVSPPPPYYYSNQSELHCTASTIARGSSAPWNTSVAGGNDTGRWTSSPPPPYEAVVMGLPPPYQLPNACYTESDRTSC